MYSSCVALLRRVSVLVAVTASVTACATVDRAAESGDLQPRRTDAAEALRTEAADLRRLISVYNLDLYVTHGVDEADAAYRRGVALLGEDDAEATLELRAARQGFQAVYDQGFSALLRERRNVVERQIEAGIDVRADVAARSTWSSATAELSLADMAVEDGDYQRALELYETALQGFSDATEAASSDE